uniref:Uncharacterized protein n=1 Tax=Arundo donax TaxID=35708 RepID=A0A0A9DKC5_ARUDO
MHSIQSFFDISGQKLYFQPGSFEWAFLFGSSARALTSGGSFARAAATKLAASDGAVGVGASTGTTSTSSPYASCWSTSISTALCLLVRVPVVKNSDFRTATSKLTEVQNMNQASNTSLHQSRSGQQHIKNKQLASSLEHESTFNK